MASAPSRLAYRNLPLLLQRTREHVVAPFRAIVAEQGLTEQQWRIIRIMLDTGPIEPYQLVSLCSISSPSLTGILGRMEQQELVKRHKMGHDHRRRLIRLTDRGQALAETIVPRINEAYRQLESRLGEPLIASLVQTLEAVNARLDHPGDADRGQAG
ncbi:homoprotocatechuate degradation operon regulator HpaR [Frateuria aurantia]|nr:homoprotocatechuate degradation operon regulator HpaR [Frateuria aurantia]